MQEPPQCAEAANREAAPQHRFLDMLSPAGYRYWMPATDIAQREGGGGGWQHRPGNDLFPLLKKILI